MTSAFYEAGVLRQIATNLFYGWGYNFYRRENQLRADDLLVRAQVGALLLRAQASVAAAEAAYRREHLPPPSREKPRPDAAAVVAAQALERLAREIGALEGQVRAQPVPANDRMTQRYRQEAATLGRLLETDERLVGQAGNAAGDAGGAGWRLAGREQGNRRGRVARDPRNAIRTPGVSFNLTLGRNWLWL